jgi:hypothetical protein
MMLYVQFFIVVFEKQIKVEPTAFLIHAAHAKKFQYGGSSEGVVWHQKGVALLLANFVRL